MSAHTKSLRGPGRPAQGPRFAAWVSRGNSTSGREGSRESLDSCQRGLASNACSLRCSVAKDPTRSQPMEQVSFSCQHCPQPQKPNTAPGYAHEDGVGVEVAGTAHVLVDPLLLRLCLREKTPVYARQGQTIAAPVSVVLGRSNRVSRKFDGA